MLLLRVSFFSSCQLRARPLESRARRSTSTVRKYMYCQINLSTTASTAPHRLTSSEKLFISYCTSPCMFLWNSECYRTRKSMALLVKPISLQRFNISSPTMKRCQTQSPDNTIIFLLCRRSFMYKVPGMLASTIRTKSSIETRPTNIQCSHSVHGYVERVHCIHDCE